jgi:pimeloyl-ACP methyl ester carboxylesterase
LNACFNDPSLPMCGALTMCLLQGLPNDCGLPPIDFAGLSTLFQSLYLMPPGCHSMPDAEAACTFPGPDFNGTTTDYDFCVWTESHALANPNATFGWLAASYRGIDDMLDELQAVTVPTLVLSSPIDPIVVPEAHVEICNALSDCTYVPFPPNPDEGVYFFHSLLVETRNEDVIAVIRQFLSQGV